jgi:hypothetical protein
MTYPESTCGKLPLGSGTVRGAETRFSSRRKSMTACWCRLTQPERAKRASTRSVSVQNFLVREDVASYRLDLGDSGLRGDIDELRTI